MIYLDNAATTKVSPQAAEGVITGMTECFGNPSSLHKLGVDAERLVSFSQRKILSALGDTSGRIIFTSGATESNNTAVFGLAEVYGRRKKRVVTTSVEHPSVAKAFERLAEMGYEVAVIRPNEQGEITGDMLVNAVDSNTCLISAMLVNNETGYILPIEKAFPKIKKLYPECMTHCDCVQGFEKLHVSVKKLGCDALSLSGHKIYAPKGIGALYLKSGVRIKPMMLGGGQQNALRSGTEPVPLIYGMGRAVEALDSTLDERLEHVGKVNSYARDALAQVGAVILSKPEASPYILSVAVPGLKSETVLHYLESAQIYVSSGSACSKGKKSGVLAEFKVSDKYIDSVIRLSFSYENTKEDIDLLAAKLREGMESLAKIK